MNSKSKSSTKTVPKAVSNKEKTPATSPSAAEADLQKQLKECRAELICFRAKFDPVEIEKYKIQNVTTEQMFQDALLNAERDLKVYESGASDSPMVKEIRLKLVTKEKECNSLKQAAKYDAEEITILKRRCVSLDSECVKLRSQIESLQKQLKSTDDIRRNIEALQKENEECKKEKEQAIEHLATCQKQMKDMGTKEKDLIQETSTLKQEMHKAETEIKDLKSTNHSLKDTIADLKYELSVSRSGESSEVSDMRKKFSKLETDLNNSEKESSELRIDVQQLKRDLQQSREDNEHTLYLKNQVEDELIKIQTEADSLRQEIVTQSELLQARHNDIDELHSKLSDYGAKGLSTSVDGRISEADRDNELGRLRAENKELLRSLETEKDAHIRTKMEKEDLEMKCHDAFEKISQKERKLAEMDTNHKQQITRRDATIKELRKERTMVDPTANSKRDVSTLESSNIRLLEQVEVLKKENSVLKSRISNQNNVNTNGDPADPYRPEKIADRFLQLYNNEWKDLFKCCETESGSARKSAQKLLGALMDVYKHCQDQALRVPEKLLNSLQSLSKFKDTFDVTKMPADRLLKLKEFTYIFAPDLTNSVIQEYMKDKSPNLARKDLSDRYIAKCVELCWIMCVQIPPLVLDSGEESTDFDETVYKPYKTEGKKLDYILWPPVRLHKNGPLICKGIAEGK